MNDAVETTTAPPSGCAPCAPGDDGLARLRRLLLTSEQDRLADIEHRLDDPAARAEELSRILPESLARAAGDGDRLAVALSGVMDDALAASIRKHRQRLADTLAPAMGPAIRRAIAEALRTMVDSFNQVLQYSFSWRALRWRVEAWRTDREFAEVLLSHSLVYRVEQVFLVHRDSGLLLQHVAVDPALAHDGDLVSGMLTAIRDFVRDSFSVDAEQSVDAMRVGDLTVMVEQGADAYLASVVRGAPPVGLRAVLRDAIETIQLDFVDAFESFSGDNAPFDEARHSLEACLQMELQGRTQKRFWLAPAIAGVVAVLLLATWAAFEIRAARRWGAYLARLSAEPGVVVVAEDHGIRRASVAGLLDPDAADPVTLLAAHGLDPARVTSQWKPFLSQEPAIILARARSWIQPPASVQLRTAGGVLSATGSAPHQWVLQARRKAGAMPGVLTFETGGLTDEGTAAVGVVQRRLEQMVVRFDPGSAELPPGEAPAFDAAVTTLQELSKAAVAGGVAIRVDVIGHTDDTGSERTNVRLSRARAEWALSAIEARGIRDMPLALVGAGSSDPLRPGASDEDRFFNRSVRFRVRVE